MDEKRTQHQQRAGTRLTINQPGRQDSIGLEFLGPPQFLPGPSPDTKDCCPLEQGFLGFIISQMCRHGNPSQALNLPLCRGMLSLLTAVFPLFIFLRELGELDVPFRAAERGGEAWDSSGGK